MLKIPLILVLLFVAAFSLATYLQPLQEARDQAERKSASVLSAVLGDGKRLFANDFFAKADAYFHRGNYPSIFELSARKDENHMAEAAAQDPHIQDDHREAHEGHGEHDAHEGDEHHEDGAPARDWIERFGRHFHPMAHLHLGKGEEREMLPWLRLSAELDPHQVESYMVAAYWLRDRLGKVDEAEQFLREGLRQNPGNVELLHEMGRLYFSNRQDPDRAKNLWLAALRRWNQVKSDKNEPDKYLLEQILGGLVRVALREGDTNGAVNYLNRLKQLSPVPDAIQKRIDELNGQSASGH